MPRLGRARQHVNMSTCRWAGMDCCGVAGHSFFGLTLSDVIFVGWFPQLLTPSALHGTVLTLFRSSILPPETVSFG